MKNKRILIVGASGLVGGNCLKYFQEKEQIDVVGTYFSFETEGLYFYDTLNPENPKNFNIDSFNPTHILHAGALTNVDYCEQHPEESFQKTVVSTQNILGLADKYGATVIYISTDYVFDGKSGPYDEYAPVNPISIYARHKLDAEELVIRHSENNLVLRVTNVYGDENRNKNFVSRLLEIGSNSEKVILNLPVDQYATPVNASDIAKALFLLIQDDKKGIYNIASTDYLNRVQLAEKVLKRFPYYIAEINARLTSDLGQPAARPLQGGLKASKFLLEYPDFYFSSVDEYLNEKK